MGKGKHKQKHERASRRAPAPPSVAGRGEPCPATSPALALAPSSAPAHAGAAPAGSGGRDEQQEQRRRRYLQQKLIEAVRKGREQEAAALLERLWPSAEEAALPDRLRWLIIWMPCRVAGELARCRPEQLARPPLPTLLGEHALLLPEEAVAALSGMDLPWVTEIRCAREATALLGEGENELALERLRTIGLRSPLKELRLLLKGLAALYQGNDDDAARCVLPLRGHPVFDPVSEAALAVAGHGSGPAAEQGSAGLAERRSPARRPVNPFFAALGDEQRLARRQLGQLRQLLVEGRPNAALHAAAELLPAQPLLARVLRRDLPAAMLGQGLPPEEVLSRVRKAFPPDAEDRQGHRLRALLYAASGSGSLALESWQAYLHQIEQGAVLPGEAERTMARTELMQRIARLQLEQALVLEHGNLDDDEEEDEPFRGLSLPWEDDEESRQEAAARERESARLMLEEAIRLDPQHRPLWLDLVEASREARGEREADRVLERFVATFPDDPQTLLAAAGAARQREAYDKALRYVQRAAALEPMNRVARDMEVGILLGKARRKQRDGDAAAAGRLYGKAADVEQATPDQRLAAAAELVAFLWQQGSPARGQELRAKTLAGDDRPWLWTGYLAQGLAHLQQSVPRQGRRGGRRRRGAPWPELLPDQLRQLLRRPPGAEELSALLGLLQAARQQAPDAVHALQQLLQQALEEGAGLQLTRADELRTSFGLCRSEHMQLRLAEHAAKLHPQEPQFTCLRYDLAIRMQLPASYFATADAELERLEQAVRGPGAQDDEGLFSRALERVFDELSELAGLPPREMMDRIHELFGPTLGLSRRIAALRRAIRLYLSGSKAVSPPSPAGRRKGSDAGGQSSSQQQQQQQLQLLLLDDEDGLR